MKKKVLKTTFLLLMISGTAKLFSFFIRILIARILSEEAIHYYSLSMPVLMFLITLSNFGIPNALTKLVASKKDAKSSIFASIILSIVNNLLLCGICMLAIPLYARIVMKQNVLIPVLYACVPMLPVVMATGLLKGYFTGKQKMVLASSSQITEEIFRILFLLWFYPSFSNNAVSMASFAIFSQTIGEIGSCLHLSIALIFQHKSQIRSFFSLQLNPHAVQELLSLSVPMTAARLIGSLTSFLEPVILVHFASEVMHNNYISLYSQLNTYILPLITLPGFFSVVISSWVLPAFSEAYEHHLSRAKHIFFLSTGFCLFLGISSSILLFQFSTEICQLLYHKTDMSSLLRLLSLPFSIYAAQPVLSCILHGASKSFRAMADTTFGCILRLISLILFCRNNISYGAAYALIISSLSTTLLHFHGCFRLFIHRPKTITRP